MVDEEISSFRTKCMGWMNYFRSSGTRYIIAVLRWALVLKGAMSGSFILVRTWCNIVPGKGFIRTFRCNIFNNFIGQHFNGLFIENTWYIKCTRCDDYVDSFVGTQLFHALTTYTVRDSCKETPILTQSRVLFSLQFQQRCLTPISYWAKTCKTPDS